MLNEISVMLNEISGMLHESETCVMMLYETIDITLYLTGVMLYERDVML